MKEEKIDLETIQEVKRIMRDSREAHAKNVKIFVWRNEKNKTESAYDVSDEDDIMKFFHDLRIKGLPNQKTDVFYFTEVERSEFNSWNTLEDHLQ